VWSNSIWRRNEQPTGICGPFGEALDLADGGLGPAGAAEDHHRTLGAGEAFCQLLHLGVAGAGGRYRIGQDLGGRVLDHFAQHVLGERQHHRAGTAGHGHREGAVDEFGDTGRVVDLGHPLGEFGEGAAVFDFLKGLAFAGVALDLADEQDHRDRILARDVQACGGVGGAGAAGDEADAGLAGEPSPGVRHHRRSAFLTADGDADAGIHQRVEDGEITFARHAEQALDAIGLEGIDYQLAAGFHVRGPLDLMVSSSARTSSVCSPSRGLGRS
jgi:hypothetical protein